MSISNDALLITDTQAHRSVELSIPLREAGVPSYFPTEPEFEPSPYWGDEIIFDAPANPHNPMMDGQGRLWLTSAIRQRRNPGWCQEGSDHPSARYFPLGQSGRQVSVYDPTTEAFVLIDSCFNTHHLQFAEDAQDTLWLSGGIQVIGWLDTKLYDEMADERAAQGWCPTVIDTNGDGVITKPWNEPNDPIDPSRDTRTARFAYGAIVNPVDGSAWITRTGPFPGRLVRLDRGDNPPETCIAEVYEPPYDNAAVPSEGWGFSPRGIDVTRDGIIWTALSGSGHLTSFDRSKCQVLNGPAATGQHCAEGWTLYPSPGPQMDGVELSGSAVFHILQLGRPVQHVGSGREHPDRGRLRIRLVAGPRPGDEGVGRPAGAVPARLLLAGARRSDRRSEWGLEGAWALGQLRVESQLARRRREGDSELGRPLPVEAASPGELAEGGAFAPPPPPP